MSAESDLTHWCPPPSDNPEPGGGFFNRLYNGFKSGVWIPAVWVGVCVTLAGSLVLSAVESARSAGDLSRQIEQLEEQIRRVNDRNAEQSPDGRQ